MSSTVISTTIITPNSDTPLPLKTASKKYISVWTRPQHRHKASNQYVAIVLMDIHNESSMMCVLIKQKSPPQRLSPSLKEFSPEKKERKQHSTDQTKVPQMQTHRKNDWGVTLEKKKD